MSGRLFYWVLIVFCLGFSGGVQAQGLSGLARVDVANSATTDTRFGAAQVRLTLSQGVPYRIYTLADPARLVIDFREVDWTGVRAEDLRQGTRIRDLRFGGFRPGWSRLVADLDGPMLVSEAEMAVDDQDGSAVLTVSLSKASSEAFVAGSGVPADPDGNLPLDPLMAAPKNEPTDRMVVMLDPGHGGIDPGAQNGDATEAQLMLALARELQETLRRAGGFEVYLTRDADVFVSLEMRVALAHRAGADVFISLHADALNEGFARGATVYTLAAEASDAASAALAERHDRGDILSGVDLSQTDDQVANVLLDIARLDNSPRSQALANSLVGGIENAVGQVHKRPLRRAGFSVLKAADIPSVLIEVGFLSTNADLKSLKDPIWRSTMAAGIRDGLAAWALEDEALSRLRRQ